MLNACAAALTAAAGAMVRDGDCPSLDVRETILEVQEASKNVAPPKEARHGRRKQDTQMNLRCGSARPQKLIFLCRESHLCVAGDVAGYVHFAVPARDMALPSRLLDLVENMVACFYLVI